MASALCIASSFVALTTNSLDVLEIGGGILSAFVMKASFAKPRRLRTAT